MKCDECMGKISLYIDQMLNEEEEKAIMAHLDLCEKCHEEYQILIGIKGLLKQSKEAQLPKEFHTDLMKQLKQEQKVIPVKMKRFKWEYPVGLVASLLIGFIAFNSSFFTNIQKKEASQVPMVTNSIQDNSETEVAGEEIEDKPTKEAKVLEAPSATMNKAESAEKDETKRLVAEAYDTSMEPITWEATVTESSTFIKVVKDYLEEHRWTYTEEEGYLFITNQDDRTDFLEWLQTQSEVKQLVITHPTGSDLKLIYHQ